MSFGQILGDAWLLTFRCRSLWALGLLAGGTYTTYGLTLFPALPLPAVEERVGRLQLNTIAIYPERIPEWLQANGDTIALLLVLLLIMAFAQTGLIGSISHVAMGDEAGIAFAGVFANRHGWRCFGLWLLVPLVGMVPLLPFIVLSFAFLLLGILGPASLVLAYLFLASSLVHLFVLAPTALALAERALLIDNLGVRAAIWRGFSVAFRAPLKSLLLWGTSLIPTVCVLLAVRPALGGVFVDPLAARGDAAVLVAHGLQLVLTWGALAIANVQSAAHWTLGYLWVTGRESTLRAPADSFAPRWVGLWFGWVTVGIGSVLLGKLWVVVPGIALGLLDQTSTVAMLLAVPYWLAVVLSPSLLLGIGEWLILRRWVRSAGWWVSTTVVGVLSGQVLASVALAIFPSPASLFDLVEFAPDDDVVYYAAQGAITGAVWGAISGGTLGALQAIVLWRAVRGAGVWPAICAVGGLAGAAVTSALTWGATGDPPLSERVMGLVTGLDALNAAITAGVIGLGLVKLLERQAAMERLSPP